VAEQGGSVIGHILFSPVTIDRGTALTLAVGLAPLAVLPAFQRKGLRPVTDQAGGPGERPLPELEGHERGVGPAWITTQAEAMGGDETEARVVAGMAEGADR
jgi:predicted N-acetyltransferase YhbS